MYTREEILMESEFDASLAKIESMSMMMLENYAVAMEFADDEDVFEEATGNIGKTLMSKVSSIIAKIRQYIQDTLQKIRDMHQKRQIDKLMSPEFKAAVKALDDGKLKNKKVPDVVALAKLATASEKYIDKTISAYNKEMAKFLDAVSVSDKPSRKRNPNKVSSEKFVEFCKNMSVGYQKIEDEVEKAYNAQIPLTKQYLIKMVQAGINSEEDFKDIEKKLKEFESSMNSVVKGAVSSINTAAKQGFGFKVNKSFGEGVEDMLDDIDEDLLMDESAEDMDDIFEEKKSVDSEADLEKTTFLAKVNSALSSALSTVSGFFRKHGKLILKISTALAAVAALIFGGKQAIKYADKMDKDVATAGNEALRLRLKGKQAEDTMAKRLNELYNKGKITEEELERRLSKISGTGSRLFNDANARYAAAEKARSSSLKYRVGDTLRNVTRKKSK